MRLASRISASCYAVLGAACVALMLAATPRNDATQQPGQRPVEENVLKLHAQIVAFEQTSLYSKMEGLAVDIKVDIGDRVKKGELLLKVFVPDQEAMLKQKEALVAAADADGKHAQQVVLQSQADRNGITAQIKEAEAGVKLARIKLAMAKSAWEGGKKLFDSKAFSQEDVADRAYQMDAANAALEQAEAKVQVTQAALERAIADVGAAQAKAKAAEAQRDVAKWQAEQWREWLHNAQIVAPYDGVVISRDVHVGQFVHAPPKQEVPLLTVVNADKVRVVINVPESAATRIKVGVAAIVKVGALGDKEIKGTVTRTSYALDADLGTLRAEIDLPNPDGLLRPGMTANATITLDPKQR